jgi:hypothetical protein
LTSLNNERGGAVIGIAAAKSKALEFMSMNQRVSRRAFVVKARGTQMIL